MNKKLILKNAPHDHPVNQVELKLIEQRFRFFHLILFWLVIERVFNFIFFSHP